MDGSAEYCVLCSRTQLHSLIFRWNSWLECKICLVFFFFIYRSEIENPKLFKQKRANAESQTGVFEHNLVKYEQPDDSLKFSVAAKMSTAERETFTVRFLPFLAFRRCWMNQQIQTLRREKNHCRNYCNHGIGTKIRIWWCFKSILCVRILRECCVPAATKYSNVWLNRESTHFRFAQVNL